MAAERYDLFEDPEDSHEFHDVPVNIPPVPELDDDFDSTTAKYVYAFGVSSILGAISVIAYKRLREAKDQE